MNSIPTKDRAWPKPSTSFVQQVQNYLQATTDSRDVEKIEKAAASLRRYLKSFLTTLRTHEDPDTTFASQVSGSRYLVSEHKRSIRNTIKRHGGIVSLIEAAIDTSESNSAARARNHCRIAEAAYVIFSGAGLWIIANWIGAWIDANC